MNKENAVHFLPFVKALALGETIQIRDNGRWRDLTNHISFNGKPEEYRIKPKERYVVVGENASYVGGAIHNDKQTALDVAAKVTGYTGPYKLYQLVEVE